MKPSSLLLYHLPFSLSYCCSCPPHTAEPWIQLIVLALTPYLLTYNSTMHTYYSSTLKKGIMSWNSTVVIEFRLLFGFS
jgi:hypothetical protein